MMFNSWQGIYGFLCLKKHLFQILPAFPPTRLPAHSPTCHPPAGLPAQKPACHPPASLPAHSPACLSTNPPICLPAHLPPTRLTACLPTHLPPSTCLPTYSASPACLLPTHPPAHLPARPPIYLPAYLPAHLPACLPVHLPVCPSACLPKLLDVWPSFFPSMEFIFIHTNCKPLFLVYYYLRERPLEAHGS